MSYSLLLLLFYNTNLPLGLHPGFLGPWGPALVLNSTGTTFLLLAFFRLFHYLLQVLGKCVLLLSGIFYPTLLPHILSTTCFYQGFPGSLQFSLNSSRALCCGSKHSLNPSIWITQQSTKKVLVGRLFIVYKGPLQKITLAFCLL